MYGHPASEAKRDGFVVVGAPEGGRQTEGKLFPSYMLGAPTAIEDIAQTLAGRL